MSSICQRPRPNAARHSGTRPYRRLATLISRALIAHRGKAVLVTFPYTHCVEVCPLIAAKLGVVLDYLGRRAARVQVVAVSVDPRRDTAHAVAACLKTTPDDRPDEVLVPDVPGLLDN